MGGEVDGLVVPVVGGGAFDPHDRARLVVHAKAYGKPPGAARGVGGAGGWWEFLQLARRFNPDAHAAWFPEQIRRRLGSEAPRLECKDLALAGWRARSLRRPGGLWRVGRPTRSRPCPATSWLAAGRSATMRRFRATSTAPAKVLGGLRLRRCGWEAAAIVQVSSEGEIHARLAEPEEIEGRLFGHSPKRRNPRASSHKTAVGSGLPRPRPKPT